MYHFGEFRVLLQELYHAVGQLCLVLDEGLGLVQGDEHLGQKLLVLGLQRQSKAVDDAAQDFQQLCHTVKLLSLINKSEICNKTHRNFSLSTKKLQWIWKKISVKFLGLTNKSD